MTRNIKLKWFYPYPPDVIWDCLTDPEKLKQWNDHNQSTDFKPEVGFQWTEKQKPRKDWDGIMYFEVLEIIPKKQLSYSFKGGSSPNKMTLDTVVTWTLVPKDGGTELHLKHSGFIGFKGAFISFIMSKGWGKFYAKPLLNYLNENYYELRSV